MSVVTSSFAGETVLIADDDAVIAELASILLRKRGFNVVTAANGEDCLEKTATHQPALILLDYMMPVMNGLEALKLLRQQHPESYVVMFTGQGSEQVAVEAMKAGAVDYFQKPFVNQNLVERIDTLLARRKVELENARLLREREQLQQQIQRWNCELEERVAQKSVELEKAHAEIVQTEKLAVLGHITAGLAHEIRNPLNSINLFAQIMLADESIVGENRDYLGKVIGEVERIDTMLMKLLDVNRNSYAERKPVCLKTVLQQELKSLESLIRTAQVDVQLSLDEPLPSVNADPLEIGQIFSNLLANALHAMPDGGVLSLRMYEEDGQVHIHICDTGSGIAEENLALVFDPFFTTKAKGTGFGLSVVLRIVKSYAGKIRVESLPGKGACFVIELPLNAEKVQSR